MHRYQIWIDVPGHGWIAAFSYGSEAERNRVMAERAKKYPRTTYAASHPSRYSIPTRA